jgi:hypothetical protein
MAVATAYTQIPGPVGNAAPVWVQIGAVTSAAAMIQPDGAVIEIAITSGSAPTAGSRGMPLSQYCPPFTPFAGATGTWTAFALTRAPAGAAAFFATSA